MKSVVKYGLLGLLVYGIFLIVYLPATQVLGHVSLPKQVSLAGVSGTIWRGKAQLATLQGLPVNNLRWSLDFLPLLMGRFNVDVQAGNVRDSQDIAFNGHISLSSSRIHVQQAQAYLPTDLIITMLPLPFPVKAQGRFKILLNDMDYQQSCQTVDGSGQWLNAKVVGLNGWIDLGYFDATLGCENGSVLLNVSEPNSFGLTARALLPANGKFSVNAKFKPADNLPEEVHQAAQFFGQPDAQGYYTLKL